MKRLLSAIALSALAACGGGGSADPGLPVVTLPAQYDAQSAVHTPASAMILGVFTIELPGPKVLVPAESRRAHMFLTIDHDQSGNVIPFDILETAFQVIDRRSGLVVYWSSEPRARTGDVTSVHLYYGPTIHLPPGEYDLFVRLTVKAYDQGGARQVAALADADTSALWQITVD